MLTVQSIYDHYRLPRNLRRHMYRVASVGQYIAQESVQPLAEDDIVVTLLVHDLANLLKFDFTLGADLLDPDERDIEYWRQVQAEMREQYGNDVHTATLAMAREIGVSERVLYLIETMSSEHIAETLSGNDWERKIVIYADVRVSPHGFVTIGERFADLVNRYAHRNSRLADQKAVQHEKEQCLQLEQQISEHLQVDVQNLPKERLEELASRFAEETLSL